MYAHIFFYPEFGLIEDCGVFSHQHWVSEDRLCNVELSVNFSLSKYFLAMW